MIGFKQDLEAPEIRTQVLYNRRQILNWVGAKSDLLILLNPEQHCVIHMMREVRVCALCTSAEALQVNETVVLNEVL